MVDLAPVRLLLGRRGTDKVLDDAKHINVASLAPDVLCLTFNGLSKAYRVAGYRAGWLAITGPKDHAESFIEGMSLLANMRLCRTVPAQHAIPRSPSAATKLSKTWLPAVGCSSSATSHARLDEIPGVSCVKPEGALYTFPRSETEVSTSKTTNSWYWTCCCRRRSWSPEHGVQLAARITCAS